MTFSPIALCIPPPASLHLCECPGSTDGREHPNNTVANDYTTYNKQLIQLALFACDSQVQVGEHNSGHIHTLLHFLWPTSLKKSHHQQGNLTATQTWPHCMRKGENPSEYIAHVVTAPSRWLHVKCLEFPTAYKQAHNRSIDSYEPYNTLKRNLQFSTWQCGIEIRRPRVHTV